MACLEEHIHWIHLGAVHQRPSAACFAVVVVAAAAAAAAVVDAL
jgi:hypothetical protein